MSFSSIEAQRAFLAPRLRRWYPSFKTGGDIFRESIQRSTSPDSIVLDAGCGRGGIIDTFHGKVQKIVGVDVDAEAVQQHTALDERIVATLERIPLADGSVDCITSEFVVEHLVNPEHVFRELHRVLKPSGHFLFLTSNVLNPVMALSAITPRNLHERLKRTLLKKDEQVFSTYYRANTPKKIRNMLEAAGFFQTNIALAGNPEYLAFEPWLATPAVLFERFLGLRPFRQAQMYIVGDVKK